MIGDNGKPIESADDAMEIIFSAAAKVNDLESLAQFLHEIHELVSAGLKVASKSKMSNGEKSLALTLMGAHNLFLHTIAVGLCKGLPPFQVAVLAAHKVSEAVDKMVEISEGKVSHGGRQS